MSICPACGASFECGATDAKTEQPCWCTQLPLLPRDAYRPDHLDAAASRCFCPHCLRALLAEQRAGQEQGSGKSG